MCRGWLQGGSGFYEGETPRCLHREGLHWERSNPSVFFPPLLEFPELLQHLNSDFLPIIQPSQTFIVTVAFVINP